jgi:cobalamin-dependent methionine synthase I
MKGREGEKREKKRREEKTREGKTREKRETKEEKNKKREEGGDAYVAPGPDGVGVRAAAQVVVLASGELLQWVTVVLQWCYSGVTRVLQLC